jgi:hypothetical protein
LAITPFGVRLAGAGWVVAGVVSAAGSREDCDCAGDGQTVAVAMTKPNRQDVICINFFGIVYFQMLSAAHRTKFESRGVATLSGIVNLYDSSPAREPAECS